MNAQAQTERIKKAVAEILGQNSISNELLTAELVLFIVTEIFSANADGKMEALRAFTDFGKSKG